MSEPERAAGFEILDRQDFSDATYSLVIRHPRMAKAARPGQFVIVMLHGAGERIPLTIADFNRQAGTITLVIQAVGKTTKEMQQTCRAGSFLHALVGPMGMPSALTGRRKVVCVGGGLGVAPIFPQARGFKENGAYVIGIVGFRTKKLIFWQEKFQACCDELILCTDDGSAGIKGFVSDGIKLAIDRHRDIDEVIAIGPPVMMRACAETTRPRAIKTVTGGLETKLTVNGREFNGVMPAWNLSDEDIADVLTYVYNKWGNSGQEVTPEEVGAYRVKAK